MICGVSKIIVNDECKNKNKIINFTLFIYWSNPFYTYTTLYSNTLLTKYKYFVM